jgi:hypothetical protein
MALDAFPRQSAGTRTGLFSRLLNEALAVMRERWFVYVGFALFCGASAFEGLRHSRLLERAALAPLTLVQVQPINVILILSLAALFFVLPSALRRIDSGFKMTFWRAVLTIAMIVSVGLVTEVGYAAAIIPGLIVGILLSQAIVTALLHAPERGSARSAVAVIGQSMRASFELTRGHFASTAGVVIASLAIVVVPSTIAFCAMLWLDELEPRTLVFMAPLLFLTFIYFECVRYTLVVRWYTRLIAKEATSTAVVN